MPVYTYECPQCRTRQDALRQISMRDGMNPSCQNCGTEMIRVPTPPAIVFKGSGWTRQPKQGA